MPSDESDQPSDLDGIRVVSAWSDDLFGFEPVTEAFRLRSNAGKLSLLQAVADAKRSGGHHLVVRDDDGRHALWRQSSDFWSL